MGVCSIYTDSFAIDDGSCNEIYTQKPAPYMVDMDFGHIAWVSAFFYSYD